MTKWNSVFSAIIEFALDFLETIIVSLAIFVVLYVFAIQPHQVKGLSMYPTFHDGEYLLTNKITYRFNDPNYGDIIIFKAPYHEDLDYIKRIVALPGDKVKLQGGKFFLNGEVLNEDSYLSSDVMTLEERFLKEGVEIVVPDETYFVAGDNRPHSSDSRDFGPVPEKNIIGKAWFRYWPPQRMGLIQHS